MNVLPEVAAKKDYLVSVRRHLHKNPERSMEETATSAYIEEQLDSMGIVSRRIGQTGLLGIITGEKGRGKTVLLRAEVDALPIQEENNVPYCSQTAGVMHACGHDVHMAALLGAAKVLQAKRDTFCGRILLAFQQAEEFGHGSKFFMEEKIMDHVDRVFGIHVWPDYPVGTVGMVRGADAASCDYFKITVNGRDAHISRMHMGIDALHIASLIVTKLHDLVEETVEPPETALVGVGKITSGTAYNVIAGKAVIEGTTRAFSDETQHLLKQKVIELAEKIAAEHGGAAVTEFETFTSALINDNDAFDEVYRVAEEIVGAENIVTDKAAIVGLGADDFAEYLQDAKGVYLHVGSASKNNPNTHHPLHSSKFDVDEKTLLVAASFYTNYPLSFLQGEDA